MPKNSTIENRVYIFRDLAAAFLGASAAKLTSDNESDRSRIRDALAEIAYVSCIVADSERLDAAELKAQILR